MFTDDRQLKALMFLIASSIMVLVALIVAELSLAASILVGTVGICGFVIAFYQLIMGIKESE